MDSSPSPAVEPRAPRRPSAHRRGQPPVGTRSGRTHLTRSELRARLRRDAERIALALPVWAWLALLVGLSALQTAMSGRRLSAPWIFPDELIYAELAKSLAATGEFAVREVPGNAYGVVYPALLAPAWAIFEHVPDAYAASKLVNSLVISLAAIPAYLLARRVLRKPYAFAAALMTVAVPSMAYAGTLMTENAFYPVFLTAALATVLVLERPTAARQLALLASLLVAVLTRTQAVALVPAVLAATIAMSAVDARAAATGARGALRLLGRYAVLWGAFALGVVAVLASVVRSGRPAAELLGGYAVAVSQYRLESLPRWLLYHVAEFDLYLGVLPFVAVLALLPRLAGRLPSERPLRLHLVVTTAFAGATFLLVSAFSTLPGRSEQRVHERAVFYLAPLFFVALLFWVERRPPRRRPFVVVAAAVAAILPAALPYSSLAYNAAFEALALVPWSTTLLSAEQVAVVATVYAAVLAGVFVLLPRRVAALAPVIVLLTFYVVGSAARHQMATASADARLAGVGTADPAWVDQAVGSDASVAVVWAPDAPRRSAWGEQFFWTRRALWQAEFFNRSVGDVYYLERRLPYGLPDRLVKPDPGGVLHDRDGKAVVAAYALAFGSTGIVGSPVARNDATGLVLYRVAGPLRLAETSR